MFRLLKFYLDLVTDDGTALIGYATRLHLGGARVGYSSVLISQPERAPVERAALDRCPLPVPGRGSVDWTCPSLRLAGAWRGRSAPIQRTLLQGPGGVIAWTCHLPTAAAEVTIGGGTFRGTGYVECLRLTVAPWRLPFRSLRWGRHSSADHSVVWIDWSGNHDARWVWVDGVDQPEAALTPTGIGGLENSGTLSLEAGREVRDRRVLASLSGALPRFVSGLATRLSPMREHKRLSRSALVRPGRAPDLGWALHEAVTW